MSSLLNGAYSTVTRSWQSLPCYFYNIIWSMTKKNQFCQSGPTVFYHIFNIFEHIGHGRFSPYLNTANWSEFWTSGKLFFFQYRTVMICKKSTAYGLCGSRAVLGILKWLYRIYCTGNLCIWQRKEHFQMFNFNIITVE
jgi:hypothetical protein